MGLGTLRPHERTNYIFKGLRDTSEEVEWKDRGARLESLSFFLVRMRMKITGIGTGNCGLNWNGRANLVCLDMEV